MAKQSANRHNRSRQGNNKPANTTASSRPQTAKTNGTVATKPVETTAKTNGTTPAKPASTATKSSSNGSTRPAQPGPGTLKRAQQRKQQKVQNRLDQQREDSRSTRITLFTVAVVVILVGALITGIVIHNNAGTDNLAQAQQIVDPNYGPIDGVYCSANEQLAYHIHAHLSIYMNGNQVPLVANTGIAPIGQAATNPTCFYWLHTHDATGVVHIESPTTKLYTLSQFFDIWERFSSSSSVFPTELSSSTGWVIYVNGKQVNTDFNHLQLHAHDLITLAYNSPGVKPDTVYSWGQL